MRVDTGPVPSFTPSPPPRPVLRPSAELFPEPPGHAGPPAGDEPRGTRHRGTRREGRRQTLAAFAVAATALLMPFTALVSLALAVVGHAKGDERLGNAAFLVSLAAMAAGFALNLTVIDVAF